MNYFEFYDLPVRIQLDEADLKRRFYKKSKELHPDFYTLESAERQAEVLELASFNNDAYKVLKDFDKRLKYILELNNILEAEGNNQIPQDFLMEMMEVNEGLMELEFDFDAEKFSQTKAQVEALETALQQTVDQAIEQHDKQGPSPAIYTQLKDYYLKKRYLLRIYENLNKFASA